MSVVRVRVVLSEEQRSELANGAELSISLVTAAEEGTPAGPPAGPLAPLMLAGLLSAGETLTWSRTRRHERFTAVVLADGRLELPDGSRFSSPSALSRELTGKDGAQSWSAWRTKDNVTLETLRDSLNLA